MNKCNHINNEYLLIHWFIAIVKIRYKDRTYNQIFIHIIVWLGWSMARDEGNLRSKHRGPRPRRPARSTPTERGDATRAVGLEKISCLALSIRLSVHSWRAATAAAAVACGGSDAVETSRRLTRGPPSASSATKSLVIPLPAVTDCWAIVPGMSFTAAPRTVAYSSRNAFCLSYRRKGRNWIWNLNRPKNSNYLHTVTYIKSFQCRYSFKFWIGFSRCLNFVCK